MTFSWRRGLLTLGALLPYWRLLTFQAVFLTDDYFASDIFNGELPGRVLVGDLIRHGQWPVWTTQLCSGLPLAGTPADPIGLAAFSLFAPAAALDLYIIVLLLVAAHGAYGLARRFGADDDGALVAGLAFAGSGYIAAQLKHLAIVSTVVWLPVGLLLLDRVLAPVDGTAGPRLRARVLAMGVFGLVFAQQVLAGFPQSAYICALVYGAFALFRALQLRRAAPQARLWHQLLVGLAIAVVLGAAAGAVVLLPLSQLGAVSDRAEDLGWDWATRLAYWPKNLIMFLFPYANGDISKNTYDGPPFFWEDYGYIGFVPFLLALYGGVRERKRPMVLFAIAMTLVAMLLVLGRATPVYRVAYLLIPGLKMFRFPTRFLIVVELGLAILAAVGLTRIKHDLRLRSRGPLVPGLVASFLIGITALDLSVHQPRQNPMVPAARWLAPPRAVDILRADTPHLRTFTPKHRDFHRAAFLRAHGWTDVEPYYALRDVLEPNTGGGLWGVPSADCYAGISARWSIDVWGDHNREASLAGMLTAVDFASGTLRMHPAFPNVLRTFGVTHVLSPFPQSGASLTQLRQDPNAYIYRVEGSTRARIVTHARAVKSDPDAVKRLTEGDFNPDAEVLLHDAGDAGAIVDPPDGTTAAAGHASIVQEDSTHLVVDVDAPAGGFVVLGDTYYPGWSATVDGNAATVFRANLAARAVPVPAGRHQVRFTYDPPGFRTGLVVSSVALGALLLWIGGAAIAARRDGAVAH